MKIYCHYYKQHRSWISLLPGIFEQFVRLQVVKSSSSSSKSRRTVTSVTVLTTVWLVVSVSRGSISFITATPEQTWAHKASVSFKQQTNWSVSSKKTNLNLWTAFIFIPCNSFFLQHRDKIHPHKALAKAMMNCLSGATDYSLIL